MSSFGRNVESASGVRNTCVVSIDFHLITFTLASRMHAQARTRRHKQKSGYNICKERRTNDSSKPLLNVQQSNPIIRSLNTCSLSLPHSPSGTHLFGYPMASAVLSRTHLFGHPLASAVLTLPLTFPLLTPNQISNPYHFSILDFPLRLP